MDGGGLVLRRDINERIFIGDDIVVTVVEICGPYSARLHISAPRDVRVDREEIRRRIEREQSDG